MARWQIALTVLLAVTMLVPVGCGVFHRTVKGLPENEVAAVHAGKKSIVLFRLAPRIDNTVVTPADKILGYTYVIHWANMDRREDSRVFRAFSPSAEAAAKNWVYFVIPPGEYWMGIRGPLDPVVSENANSRRNNFFLEVREGVPLLYAGTLIAACKSSWSLLGRYADRCGPTSTKDESEAADIVAQRDLGNLGPMETDLLRPAMRESVAEKPGDLAAMAVSVKGSPAILTPHWKERGMGRATGLGSDTFLGLLNPPPSSGGPATSLDRYQAYAFLGYALYLPIGSAVGLIGGHQSDRKWSPCMKRIAAEVSNWSPPDVLRTALVEALARRGVEDITVVDNASRILDEDGQSRFRTLFEVEVQDVVFRECGKRWTFCGEMKVRGRLRDLETGRLLYDGVLIYSNVSRRFPFAQAFYARPYEWLVASDAMCRAIEDYCDPEGAELLIRDLDSAVRFLAQRLVLEAGVPPGRNAEPGYTDAGGVSSPSTSSTPRVAP